MKTAVEWLEEIYLTIGIDRNVHFNQAKQMEIEQQGYSEEDLECAWNSSDQNMRFQFSSSAYKAITFKQWLEKYEHER
jgi:hypothetical protein